MSEDYHKTSSQEFEAIDADVVAVLVYTHSQPGCVRVVGRTVQNTITRPGNTPRRLLLFINSAKGEKGWIFGGPSLVLFRKRKYAEKEVTPEQVFKYEVLDTWGYKAW